MLKNNKYLKITNLHNSSILDYKKKILNNKVNIFVNNKKKNIFKEFIKFSKSFGTELKYNKKPYYKFTETTQRPIGLHTDGVSCLQHKKIPKLIFFYVKKWPENAEGFFQVSSMKKIISKIPKKYMKILKEQNLQYLNYFSDPKKNLNNQISFQKKCLRKVNNHLAMDMFLPLKTINKDHSRWKYQMKFENITQKNSKKILSKIRSIAENKDCNIKFPLSNEIVMVINNERFFHGREKFSKQVKRTLYRVQILN